MQQDIKKLQWFEYLKVVFLEILNPLLRMSGFCKSGHIYNVTHARSLKHPLHSYICVCVCVCVCVYVCLTGFAKTDRIVTTAEIQFNA